MRLNATSSILLAALFLASNAFSQANPGIVNGRANYLPSPQYPRRARDFCAKGKVEVRVVIGTNGKVISADAISGDELLYKVSVAAAKRARFRLSRANREGLLVYNFAGVVRCVTTGVVNGKALKRPVPIPDHSLTITNPATVRVRIMINVEGKVERVWTSDSIDPAIRSAAERLALTTTFRPTLDMPPDLMISATLEYTFKPGGKIEY